MSYDLDDILRHDNPEYETLNEEKKKPKVFKCLICKKRYFSYKLLETHTDIEHKDLIPQDMPTAQFIFNLKNKKTHGSCVICKKPTQWNEKINKYHRYCSETCKQKYVEEAKARLLRVHGTTDLSKDPEHQKKMLENRSIAKDYVYSNGKKIRCIGSYEYDFIKYCDEVMGFGPESIIDPGTDIIFEYEFEGKTKRYFPDFYIPELNLLIEIKDKGNNHPNIAIKMKQMDAYKFKAVMKSKQYNFITICGKEYEKFVQLVEFLKTENLNEKTDGKKVFYIDESVYKDVKLDRSIFRAFESIQPEIDIITSDSNLFSKESEDVMDKITENDFLTKRAFIRLYKTEYTQGKFHFAKILKFFNSLVSDKAEDGILWTHAAIHYKLTDDFIGLNIAKGEANDVKIEEAISTTKNKPDEFLKQRDIANSEYAILEVPITEKEYVKLRYLLDNIKHNNKLTYQISSLVTTAYKIKTNQFNDYFKEKYSHLRNAFKSKEDYFSGMSPEETKTIKEEVEFMCLSSRGLVCSTFVAWILSSCSEAIKQHFKERKIDEYRFSPNTLFKIPGVKKIYHGFWNDYVKDTKKFCNKNNYYKQYL